MKIAILALFVLGLSSISLAQSKYGFETGIDKIEFVHKISTSVVYEIWVDSLDKREYAQCKNFDLNSARV